MRARRTVYIVIFLVASVVAGCNWTMTSTWRDG